MGTIFVAYGEPEGRDVVLRFAIDQALASDHDLFVYHVQETVDDDTAAIEQEVDELVGRHGPEVSYELEVQTRSFSDRTNVSKVKPLTDAIVNSDVNYEYVVMGNHERSTIEEWTLPSMTKAILETYAIPVVLVPV